MSNQGAKKRKQKNDEIIKRLQILLASSNLLYILYRIIYHSDSFGGWKWFTFILMCILNGVSYFLLSAMTRVSYNQSGELIDGGSELSGGFCEYYFDIIYICSGVQILGLLSDKFLWILLIIPGFATYKIWTSFIAPWIFAAPEEQPVEDEKARKKREKLEKKQEKPKVRYVR
ncbi:hypothetical protein CYY_005425 [Polysphondylium violaceum]|uniref:Transmembrane protein n=1 Tax=Polysphondylium violaceum TaxID=133409 RepID=A0A8J4PRU4_9MYCE|nr:hypothetical protein CYY_005425 [Polysphondylium violaceum]